MRYYWIPIVACKGYVPGMSSEFDVDHIVFAGGGNRCIWQAGFWQALTSAHDLEPKSIAAVSAGAAVACMLMAGRMKTALESFARHTTSNKKNIYLGNLVNSEKLYPHERIYRSVLEETFDMSAFEKLQNSTPIHVLLGRYPSRVGTGFQTYAGLLIYEIEKRVWNPVHASLAQRMGFHSEVCLAQQCRNVNELVELILQSSCTPPVTRRMQRTGSAVLDGGIVDNVPVVALPAPAANSSTLVLLTRCYPENEIPNHTNRIYVQPSKPIELGKFDYTNPEGLQAAYDHGLRDGEAFCERIQRGEVELALAS